MEELGNLKGSEAHSTIILTDEDKNVLRKLGINVTFDPYYQYDRLYRRSKDFNLSSLGEVSLCLRSQPL